MPNLPKNLALTDDSLMTFGKQYKGDKLKDVPASYFIWIWENTDVQEKMLLGNYIRDNWDSFQMELQTKGK